MSSRTEFDWDCPSRGTFIAVTNNATSGHIQHTPAGFATFDVLNRQIGTFPDFISAEYALARSAQRETGANKIPQSVLLGAAAIGTAAILTAMIIWSVLAVTTP